MKITGPWQTQCLGNTGVNESPAVLGKKVCKRLTLPFTLLINQSFQEGYFPDFLNISLVKPVHNKGEKYNVSN